MLCGTNYVMLNGIKTHALTYNTPSNDQAIKLLYIKLDDVQRLCYRPSYSIRNGKKMMKFPHSCDTTTSPAFQMITNVTDLVTAAMQLHRAAMLYSMAVV